MFQKHNQIYARMELPRKFAQLNKRLVENLVLLITSFGLPLYLFRFHGLVTFRDMLVVPYFYNLDMEKRDIGLLERIFFNWLVDHHVRPETIVSGFFVCIFGLGTILTYIYFSKLQNFWFSSFPKPTHFDKYDRLRRILIGLLSFLYVYNPFTFERFLMGQYNVLRGHFLLIPVLYFLLLSIRAGHTYLQSENTLSATFRVFSQFGIWLLVLTLYSTHHALFVCYILIAVVLGYVCLILYRLYRNSPLAIKHFGEEIQRKRFRKTWTLVGVALLVFVPTVGLLLNRYISTNEQFFYSTRIADNDQYRSEIIRSFSLQVLPDQNIFIRGVIGSGSWNTPSFDELGSIFEKLGWWSYATLYFNSFIAQVSILLWMSIVIGSCWLIWKKNSEFLWLRIVSIEFGVAISLALVLSFGYSGGFENINWLFFQLPLSYIMREPGKFYSLVLALGLIWVNLVIHLFKKQLQWICLSIFSLTLISNILPFIPLADTVNYVIYPSSFNTVASRCAPGQKVLYLPFEVYPYPSFNETFMVNPSRSILPCEVLFPAYETVANADPTQSEIPLSSNPQSDSIRMDIQDFTSGENSEQKVKEFRDRLITSQVTYLIVDQGYSPDNIELNKRFRQFVDPAQIDGDVYLYILE